MMLTRLRISQLRSIAGSARAMDLTLASGCNVLVGPNGSGKSTVLRAITLAVNPSTYPFEPDRDLPRPTVGDSPEPAGAAATTIDLWWDGDVSAGADMGTGADAGQFGTDPPTPASTAETTSPPTTDHDNEPLLVVTNHHACSPDAAAASVRCVVVPAEHQRRDDLLGQLQWLIAEVAAGTAAADGSLTDLNDRLSTRLTELWAEATTATVTNGQDPDMVVSTGRRERTIAELTTPELLAVVVTMVAEITADASTTAPPTAASPSTLGDSWVLVVDQPETGLHPAAQHRLAAALDQLAGHRDVTVMFASHSPFMIPRTPTTRVFELATDHAGATVCTSTGDGSGPLAQVVDSLFDDPVLPDILDRAAAIADDAAGILVVEGDTDAAYIQLACTLAGRPELHADLHVAVSHGTRRLVLDALALRSLAGDRPVCVLVDHDSEGRAVAHVLTGRLGLRNHTEVVSVAIVFDDKWRGHEWDAEDLLSPDLLARFVGQHDEDVVLRGKTRRPDGQWHWDLTTEGKSMLPAWLASHATAEDLTLWLELVVTIRKRMGLDNHVDPGTATT